MATIIGAENVLGQTMIGSLENGSYVIRHGNEVVANVPLSPIAQRMNVGADVHAVINRMGHVEVSGAFLNKIKKATKKTVGKVVKAAKTVAKSKVAKTLYSAAKSAAPSPYKEYIAGAETAVKFTKAMTKNTPKGKAAKKALPVAQKLAAGKISLPAAQAKAKSLGLKPNTIRDVAASIVLRQSDTPEAKAVMEVVDDIAKVEDAPTRIVEAASGRRYEVFVKAAS